MGWVLQRDPKTGQCSWDALAQVVYTVYSQALKENKEARERIEEVLDRLQELGKRFRHADGADPKSERSHLKKLIGEQLKVVKALPLPSSDENGEKEEEGAWSHIRKNLWS